MDLGQLLFNPDPGVRAALVREIVAPIFTRARTLQGVVVLGGLMRLQRIRVRQFAADNEVDPFSLAGKLAQIGFDGEADTRINYLEPSEIEYLNMTMQMEEIVSFFKAALPDEVASILASDNITPIFDNGSLFFGDSRRSHSFIQSCTILPDTLVENWTDEDLITTAAFRSPSKVGPSDSRSMLKFLSSPIFHRVSENAIWSTRMMEGQLAADPNLLYLRIATTLNKVRIGAFHLAAWKMHFSALAMDPFASSDPVRVAAMTGLERDVKTAAAWVFAVGRRFRPFGLEYARIFAKLMIAAGMVLLPDGTAVNEILTFDKEIEAVELKREVKETDDDV